MLRDAVQTLRKLDSMKDPHARGRCFESVIARVFEAAGYETATNEKKIALGSECDVVASGHGRHILIEAKWKHDPFGRSELNALRVRLHDAPMGTIGCVFSHTRYTEPVLSLVAEERNHVIILFRPEEILMALSNPVRLSDLVEDKIAHFLCSRRVWFDDSYRGPSRAAPRVKLTDADALIVGGRRVPSLLSHDSEDALFFGCNFGGNLYELDSFVELTLVPEIFDEMGLSQLVSHLRRKLGMSSNGTFSVMGSAVSWHGVGSGNFIETIRTAEGRYRVARPKYIHHSEDFTYLAGWREGTLSISGRHGLQRGHRVDSVEVTLHMPGVPADSRPLDELRRAVHARSAYFTLGRQSRSAHLHFKQPQKLEVVGELVRREPGQRAMIVGIAVRNPFFRSRLPLPRIAPDELRLKDALRSTELLLCDLCDWHDVGDKIDFYVLSDIQAEGVAEAVALRPRATWNEIVQGAPAPDRLTGLRRLRKRWREEDELRRRFLGKTPPSPSAGPVKPRQ